MELGFFAKGVILGFSIAAPVGPIGILCIRRTLAFGRFSGLFSGIGAACADTLYGIITACGLSLVAALMKGQFWLRIVGGLFLIYLGIRTFLSKPEHQAGTVTHITLIKDFVSTFFLTLTNPMTIVSYLAIFTALGLVDKSGETKELIELVAGVFVGSLLWWFILSEIVTFFRTKVSHEVMLWVNRIAGLLIIGFGILAWVTLFYK